MGVSGHRNDFARLFPVTGIAVEEMRLRGTRRRGYVSTAKGDGETHRVESLLPLEPLCLSTALSGTNKMVSLSQRFRSWWDHKLKNGVYEVQGVEIVCGRGRRPEERLQISDIRSWRIYPEMGFDLVIIAMLQGDERRWIDTYDDLIGILREAAPDKESHA